MRLGLKRRLKAFPKPAPLMNPIMLAKYGIEITTFVIENVSVPAEVEKAIDERSSMAAVGNLNEYVKFQMAKGMARGDR